jgi:hypothetical protein
MSWHTAGTVSIDSATVMLGDPEAFLSWKTSGAPLQFEVFDETLVCLTTDGDWDCPVEIGLLGGAIVAVRVELYSDLANTEGRWESVGELSLKTPRCVVIDPMGELPAEARERLLQPSDEDTSLRSDRRFMSGALLSVPAGRYRVDFFDSEGEPLGVRLHLLGPESRPWQPPLRDV